MRDYNRSHPQHRVHFMGDDIGAPEAGDRLFARVTDYMREAHPEALQRLEKLYARRTGGTTLAIGKAYDVLIHLHQVREADKL